MKTVPIENDVYFITSVVNKRYPLFKNRQHCDSLISTLAFYRKRGDYYLHGIVIMPEHYHILIQIKGSNPIDYIIGNINRYSAGLILETLTPKESSIFQMSNPKKRNHHMQLWEGDPFTTLLSTVEEIETRLKYLHENPLRKNLIDDLKDYRLSSFNNYYGEGKIVLEIDCLF